MVDDYNKEISMVILPWILFLKTYMIVCKPCTAYDSYYLVIIDILNHLLLNFI